MYFYYEIINETLNTKSGLFVYFLFGSIPFLYVLTYPPSIVLMEFATLYSIGFLRYAVKQWIFDFKEDYKKTITKMRSDEKHQNTSILSESKKKQRLLKKISTLKSML